MRRTGLLSLGRATIAAAIASAPLAACSHVPDAVNPVEWYRDVAGYSKNDAQDQNQQNEKSLEAGAKEPYPNLANVPNVPDNATSTFDRDKLKESLIADREHANYNNEQLQAGRQLAAAVPPPPPLSPSPPAAEQQSQHPSTQPQAHATQPSGGPRQAAPMESSLQSPAVPEVPQGETPAPPPPPPPNVTTSAPPASREAAPPAQQHTQATPPPVRENQPQLAMRTPASAANAISVSVGDISFASGSSTLSGAQRSTLAEIAGLYKQTGGKIRVVGHAERQPSKDLMQQSIAMLNLSLDRANAVAQALTQMGVPATDITIQAAPEKGGQEIPRAEVFMEY
jgi:outer membrane protein OmpA-like peptidoglycan-associated protein